MFTQTHESHLEEKTKLYDELRQQFDKVLEQKVEQVRGPPPAVYTDLHTHTTPTQVQSVQEKTNAVGKTENENENKEKEEKEEEDIANGVLDDGEDSKKEEEEDMKVVMEPHTLSVRHNQVFLPLILSKYSSPSIIRTLDYLNSSEATLILFIMNIIIIYTMADLL